MHLRQEIFVGLVSYCVVKCGISWLSSITATATVGAKLIHLTVVSSKIDNHHDFYNINNTYIDTSLNGPKRRKKLCFVLSSQLFQTWLQNNFCTSDLKAWK